MDFERLQNHPVVESTVTAAWSAGKFINHDVPGVLQAKKVTGQRTDNGFDPSLSDDGGSSVFGAEETSPPLSPGPDTGVDNPVLTASDVTDYGNVDFIADPFLYPTGDKWHLFFEVYNHARDPPAVIGRATSSRGYEWNYEGVALNTGQHLSFPFVFGWEGSRYMIPEEAASDGTEVTLYRAVEFPTSWTPVATPVSASHRTDDTIIFRWNDRWWLLIGDTDLAGFRIYASDSLETDNWEPHNKNPVVTDRSRAFRPGGRPIVYDDAIYVYFQDCDRKYGHKVRGFEITRLSRETYSDREVASSPVLEGTGEWIGWNAGRMHHIDPWLVGDRWLCAVDGNINTDIDSLFTARHWAIGIYTV